MNYYRNKNTGYFSKIKNDEFTELFNGDFKIGDQVLGNLSGVGYVFDELMVGDGYTPHVIHAANEVPFRAKNLHAPGAKDDAEKQLPQVVLGGFAFALVGVIEVGTSGAKKYSRDGWLSVDNATDRYMGALLRHLLDHMTGQTIDKDSGFSQLRHIAWNALALFELDERNDKN